MARLPSLPEKAHLLDVFRDFGRGVWALTEYHDALLRGPSDWSVGEREAMAAYVSALNACSFCHASHTVIAEVHGMPEEELAALLEEPEDSGTDPQLTAVLVYLRKLTLSPAKITDADARAVLATGVSEQALFDAISICGLFNLMNRIVEGCGIEPDETRLAESRASHEEQVHSVSPYRDFARKAGFLPTSLPTKGADENR